MLIYLLAFVGGVLTILSPCILPVLPFVFARADQLFAAPVCPSRWHGAERFRSSPSQRRSADTGWSA